MNGGEENSVKEHCLCHVGSQGSQVKPSGNSQYQHAQMASQPNSSQQTVVRRKNTNMKRLVGAEPESRELLRHDWAKDSNQRFSTIAAQRVRLDR
jgi:hypothetical protein